MPKHDAFGREIGEDPLADLGWGTSDHPADEPGATAPAPEAPLTTVVATPTVSYEPPPVAPAPPVLTPPGHDLLRIGRMIRLGISLALLAGGIIGGVAVVNAGREAAEGIRGTFDQLTPGGGSTGDAPSLLRQEGLARALDVLRRETPGRIYSLRIDADSVDLQLRLGGGRLRVVHYEAGEARPRVLSTTDAGLPAADLFGYGDLSAQAAERAARVGRRRTGRRVEYLIFDKPLGKPGWRAYTGGGQYVRTDGRGRFVSRYPPS